ncbi:hypothetical protein [Flavobacterium anhuiense]|uniref:hypothetical protein n=1 Tax=Flavobacterium anhuiense TaxID=459526 RepID=UPI001F5D4706|nr:hypothetical protein [Flavobacterium anhuiense]
MGTVDNLRVNKDMQRVVYLGVKVDKTLIEDSQREVHENIADANEKEFMYLDGDSHLIIPIGSVNINKDTKIAMARGIGYDIFRRTGRFNTQQRFDRNYERAVFKSCYPDID